MVKPRKAVIFGGAESRRNRPQQKESVNDIPDQRFVNILRHEYGLSDASIIAGWKKQQQLGRPLTVSEIHKLKRRSAIIGEHGLDEKLDRVVLSGDSKKNLSPIVGSSSRVGGDTRSLKANRRTQVFGAQGGLAGQKKDPNRYKKKRKSAMFGDGQ